jgi:formate dehydrogenase gamma subunit
MAGTITPPREASADLARFDLVERVVHWTNAVLFAVLLATAAALYVAPVSAAVGRREEVKTIHVYAGLALPVPLLLGAAGRRRGRALRSDLGRLNRWLTDDRRWLSAKLRRAPLRGIRLGKFNPGQKLNAAFTGGAMVLMLATGTMMRWYKPWPLRWRTGATFVHDWIATLLVVTITGHIYLAMSDPESLDSMRRGTISRAWARRHAPRWLDEASGEGGAGIDGVTPTPPGSRPGSQPNWETARPKA